MDLIKVRAHVDSDGMLKLEIPTEYANTDLEVALVLHPLPSVDTNEHGLPVNFFESLDAIEADDLLERPEQGTLEEREPLE
jgi:hypothetical protein